MPARLFLARLAAMATTSPSLPEILKLSVAERIQLVQDIWDSVAAEPASVPVTEPQREELDRRLADADARPGVGAPWPEVRARLLGSA